MKRTTLFTVLSLLTATAAPAVTLACPSGWTTSNIGKGVRLCAKGNHRVQMIDLSAGARIRLGYQFSGSPGSSANPNPSFQGRDVVEWWNWASITSNVVVRPSGKLYGAVNASFFEGSYSGDPVQKPTAPVKNRGIMLTVGNDNYAGTPLREFRINDADADIVYFANPTPHPRNWNTTSAAIGSFTTVTALHPSNASGGIFSNAARTYAGLRDLDNNGKYETVLLYSTSDRVAKETAYNALAQDFGSNLNIQFDGSGSSQMMVRGTEVVRSTDSSRRNFPIALLVFEAP